MQAEQQAEGQVCNMATKNKHRERSHRSYRNKDVYKQYVIGNYKLPPIPGLFPLFSKKK